MPISPITGKINLENDELMNGSATKIWATFSGCRPLFPKVFPPVAQNAAA
jgi:hypothetical protein